MTRWLTALVAILVLSSVALPLEKTSAASFSDVTMYQEEIEFLTSLQVIKGYDDWTFKPAQPIKRIQAVQMILRDLGEEPGGSPNPGFTDMKPGSYGYEEVAKAVELGIISGKNDGRFDPWGTLTRGQMAKILTNAYGLYGIYPYEFTDVQIGSWAYEYVSPLAANNITTGYDDGTFRPDIPLSRAHFAVFLARIIDPSFQKPNNKLKDSLIEGLFDFKVLDYDAHPTEPIIYVLDGKSNSVVELNIENQEVNAVELQFPVERMDYANGKIFVTQLKGQHSYYWWDEDQEGAFAVINTDTMELENTIHIKLDPYDIAADDNGVVYVSSGSGQHTNIESFNSVTGEKLSSQSAYQMTLISMHPSQNRLYSITTTVSPRKIGRYSIANGALTPEVRSPYHGDYDLTTDITISDDGSYLFNGTGHIFEASASQSADMVFAGKLDQPYKAIAFDIDYNEFYTADNNNVVRAYDYNLMRPIYQLDTYGNIQHMIYKDNKLIFFTTVKLPNSAKSFTGLETIAY
ncbi:S-layer homology domain-containing protein [Bacillus sp. AK031]